MNGEAFLKTYRVYKWASRYLDTNGQSLPSRLYEEYSPIRCSGDAIVHGLIAILSQIELTQADRYTAAMNFYNSLDEDGKRLWDLCLKYIRHTLKSWLDTGLPVLPVAMT